MEKLQSFHQRRLILPPAAGSFTAEGQASRWSNPDLDPVSKHQKKWEWYHVGGFWIAEGFSAAQIQTASASVALGLNPGTALIAYLIGNILVMMACCGSGYVGSKVCAGACLHLCHSESWHADESQSSSTPLIFRSFRERTVPFGAPWP